MIQPVKLNERGFCPKGVLSQRGFVREGFSPRGFCPRGFCPRGFCPRGFCPRGFCPRGFCPRGFVLGGFVLGGFVLGGFVLHPDIDTASAPSEPLLKNTPRSMISSKLTLLNKCSRCSILNSMLHFHYR